jgi:type IV pilus assembly protein PilN
MGGSTLIRINLLPIREFKRREQLRRQVAVFGLSIVFLIIVMGFLYVGAQSTTRDLKAERDALALKEAELKKKVALVDQLKKEQDGLQAKLNVISELETRRSGPVRVLDEISRWIPPDRAWLLGLGQAGDQLTLTGVAMDNETIALFMNRLEDSDWFQNVELVRSAQEIRNEIRLKSFSITCSIVWNQQNEDHESEITPTG